MDLRLLPEAAQVRVSEEGGGTMTGRPCDGAFGFTASDCPDYGSSDCPRTVPGAKCEMDAKYASDLLEAKARYYERKGRR